MNLRERDFRVHGKYHMFNDILHLWRKCSITLQRLSLERYRCLPTRLLVSYSSHYCTDFGIQPSVSLFHLLIITSFWTIGHFNIVHCYFIHPTFQLYSHEERHSSSHRKVRSYCSHTKEKVHAFRKRAQWIQNPKRWSVRNHYLCH